MNLADNLRNLIFPSRCIFCLKPIIKGFLCDKCFGELIYTQHRCQVCSKPVGENSLVCANCLGEHYYEKGFVLFSYNNPKVADLIKQVKFFGHFYYLKTLKQFENCIDFQIFEGVDAIVGVPMYKKDLQKRGYNQSVIIAKILSEITSIKVSYNLLEKWKLTKPQVGLTKTERLANVKNAFRVNPNINYKKVLIVDDVVTTASTINECAKILLKYNIKSNFFALASES